MSMQILIGADPEVFMRKDGKFISAHGAVKGDKKNPFKVDKGAVQVDGMALEFNIDPASSADEFVDNITSVMATLQSLVPGFELVADPVARFGLEYIQAQPEEAQELGCEPDFNAWNDGEPNPKPDGEKDFRTGAGHVHIGWTKDMDINDPHHREACIMLTKQLDYYLGLGSLLYDDDSERRTMYGAAGAFRVKSYGVEYRVLSNAWLKSPSLMRWVFETTQKAVADLFEGKAAYAKWGNDATYYLAQDKPNKDVIKQFMSLLKINHPVV